MISQPPLAGRTSTALDFSELEGLSSSSSLNSPFIGASLSFAEDDFVTSLMGSSLGLGVSFLATVLAGALFLPISTFLPPVVVMMTRGGLLLEDFLVTVFAGAGFGLTAGSFAGSGAGGGASVLLPPPKIFLKKPGFSSSACATPNDAAARAKARVARRALGRGGFSPEVMAEMTAVSEKGRLLYPETVRSANDLTSGAGNGQDLPKKAQGGQTGDPCRCDPVLDGAAALTH